MPQSLLGGLLCKNSSTYFRRTFFYLHLHRRASDFLSRSAQSAMTGQRTPHVMGISTLKYSTTTVQKSQNWTQSSDDTENKSGNLRYKSTHLAGSFKDFATPGTQMPLKFFNWAIYTLHVPKTTHVQLTSAIAPRLASRRPVTSLSNCAESTGCRLFRRKWEDSVPELEWWFFNSVFWTETNHMVHRHKQCTIVNMIFVHIKWSATEPRTGCSTDFVLSIPGNIESWLHAPSSQMFLTAHLCFWSLRNGKKNPFFGTAMFLLNTWPCY